MSTSPTTEVQSQHRSQQQLHDLSREPSPTSNIAQLVVKAISGPQTASSSPQNASQASNPPHSAPGTPQPTTNASISPINPSQPPALPSVDPNVSFQSILTISKDRPPSNGQHAPWSVPTPMPSSQQLSSPSANGKRKLDDGDIDDPHRKIRRVVRDHISQDPSRATSMTTVVCMHAAVAQKSYGSEKRFLCPPPVVHIEGPVWHMRQQQMSMSVVSETGERSFEQKAQLDNNMFASFKFLHVNGTAKAKSFLLTLDIAEPPPHVPSSDGAEPPTGRVWASFDSAPVTIISKPSKKTAKTRNISSCILAGGPVSLFNRINSQTVRTKYMTIDHTQLCASNVSWSAFNVNVVRRSQETQSLVPQPVTYGSEIILMDTHSGISTAPLVIRKVDKGKIASDDGGPVSQMQKIALQRINQDGTRHYLSAAGPMPGTAGTMSPAPGQSGSHPLIFQSPRVREDVKDGVRTVTDEVDDYLCWTIVGISKFQYTFFDALGPSNTIPELPVTPFPTLFTAPVYRPANNALELTVSNFFYENPKTRTQTPLDVYLGSIGPLRTRIYQTPLPGPLTNVSPFVQPLTPPVETGVAGAIDPQPSSNGTSTAVPPIPPRYISAGPLHTIVVVEVPPLADVINALKEDVLPPVNEDRAESGSTSQESRDVERDPGISPVIVPQQLAGRSLPLLFIRSLDGVGYHSGRTIACENVFENMSLNVIGGGPGGSPGGIDQGWLAAAQAAAAVDGGLHGWTLRVM
ncbi:hypothetical protein B0F90DRAFT_1930918 [Multifurca ochricompacta]|uniref:Transcription factor n=1 Tax=Multifurca ochricompacta TaxID=376703 RepID=A0AAD4MD12_9AGAM|nr:hypothetical protein B0F90DRAFT_1930918 [Multifurca ochricompacta]